VSESEDSQETGNGGGGVSCGGGGSDGRSGGGLRRGANPQALKEWKDRQQKKDDEWKRLPDTIISQPVSVLAPCPALRKPSLSYSLRPMRNNFMQPATPNLSTAIARHK